jgi:hypothetical protein
MATPYVPDKGHTKIVVGALYSRYPVNSYLSIHSQYRLKIHNPTTGLCKLESRFTNGYLWVSEAELSNWYRIGEFNEA